MAATRTLNEKKLVNNFNLGIDEETGKNIIKSQNYPVKLTATDDQVLAVYNALSPVMSGMQIKCESQEVYKIEAEA